MATRDSRPPPSSGKPGPQRPPLFSTALLLLPFHVVFRAGEALLPILLAGWFGGDRATDVYTFAWAVFAFAGSLIFSSFQDSALIPVLADVRTREPDLLPRVLGSLLLHTWVYGGGLALAIGLGSAGYFRLRFGEGAEFALAMTMAPLFTAGLVATATKTFYFAVLASEHRFFAQPMASAVGVATSLTLIALFRGRLGVVSIPIGTLAGEVVVAAAMAGVARRARVRVTLTLARPEPVVRFFRLVANDVGGAAITRINPIVDQLMAGLTGVVGGGTLLRYTGDVASVPNSLLQASLFSVLLSHLSDDAAHGDFRRLARTVHRAILVSGGALAGLALALWVFRAPLLELVFLHGAMTRERVAIMADILPYHLVGLVPFGILLVLARAHVALKNTGAFVVLGMLNAALNAGFNLALAPFLGLRGLALSTSLVQAVVAIAFYILFRKKVAASAPP